MSSQHARPSQADSVTQAGLRVDCAAEECDPPHEDDGRVFLIHESWSHGPERWKGWGEINGHAAQRVLRTVTYSPWAAPAADAGTTYQQGPNDLLGKLMDSLAERGKASHFDADGNGACMSQPDGSAEGGVGHG